MFVLFVLNNAHSIEKKTRYSNIFSRNIFKKLFGNSNSRGYYSSKVTTKKITNMNGKVNGICMSKNYMNYNS